MTPQLRNETETWKVTKCMIGLFGRWSRKIFNLYPIYLEYSFILIKSN